MSVKNFYDPSIYPELKEIAANTDVIRDEITQRLKWYEWPERHLYKDDATWHVYPLYGFDTWVESNCARVPETTRLLKTIPGLKTAIFSRLAPGTTLTPHYGWASLANRVLRCHLGVVVPDNCGVWVEGETRQQHPNQWLVFDDSRLHSGFNGSDRPRIVLLLDIDRPAGVPAGTSTYEQTEERDHFVKYFKRMT